MIIFLKKIKKRNPLQPHHSDDGLPVDLVDNAHALRMSGMEVTLPGGPLTKLEHTLILSKLREV